MLGQLGMEGNWLSDENDDVVGVGATPAPLGERPPSGEWRWWLRFLGWGRERNAPLVPHGVGAVGVFF